MRRSDQFRRWPLLAIALATSALVCVGCEAETQTPVEHPVRRMAPFDLNCAREQLQYTAIDADTWGVIGCGRRTKYIKLCRQVGEGWARHDECRWVQN